MMIKEIKIKDPKDLKELGIKATDQLKGIMCSKIKK